ncbi:ribonuclease P protein subunit p40 isoform X2 [Clupea harengus]|uniref:Ribonuclease P protein subunit p40 isoform X2 n=1 Tax=Clupea harengus TaxID=7950 RepID=A0A6P3VWW8_CLUHA|nr:ribonuclease P protein subunit p40 isoform X2 [Clupea harengus]
MSPELEKCSRSLLVCEKSNFTKEKSRYDIHVSKHYFNYKVSIVIPECASLPASIAGVINSFNSYYRVRDLPIYKLLEEEFLEKVVKKGQFYALSYNTRIDEDNTIAFLPSGQLILSVDKDTYEQLGLEGKPSQYKHRKVLRYVVTIDLTDKLMSPGAKRYQRLITSLKEWVPIKCDLMISSKMTAEEDGGVLQNLLSQYSFEEHRPTLHTHTLKEMPCPSLHSTDRHGDEKSCDPHHFLEWLGAVSMDISSDNEASSFLSTYVCPDPQSLMSHGLLCTVTGFLIPEDIYSLLLELRRYFDEPKFTSWLSMTVHGFVDSPVSWGTTEHGFLKSGENFYNFVCFRNQDYWLHMATGSHDGCPP